MRALIDSLEMEYEAALQLLERAENSGVEVSNAIFELGNANTALVSARAAVHSFHVDTVEAHVHDGIEVTTRAFAAGNAAMRELTFRRTGLAVSVSIIVLLIYGLVRKIREIERSSNDEKDAPA